MAYVQVELDAETVIQAMFDDSTFAAEMWHEIAEKLHMGALLDDAMDVVQSTFSNRQKQIFIGSLRLMADCTENNLEYKTDGSGELVE